MIWRALFCAPAILLWLICGVSASESERTQDSPAPPDWSERGVFAFTNFVFDFQKQLEVFGPGAAKLFNCSNAKFYCAYSLHIHLILPRDCSPLFVGEKWAYQDIEMEVLGTHVEQEGGHYTPTSKTVYYLGSAKFPHMVYVYEKAVGVSEIYFDESADLVASARMGNMSEYQVLRYHSYLLTLDNFGQCLETKT